jgi:hypothetical protein
VRAKEKVTIYGEGRKTGLRGVFLEGILCAFKGVSIACSGRTHILSYWDGPEFISLS